MVRVLCHAKCSNPNPNPNASVLFSPHTFSQTKSSTMDDMSRHGDVEQTHFQSVRQAFLHYQRHSTAVIERMQPSYGGLEVKYKEMLPDIDRHFAAMKRCVAENYDFLCAVAEIAPHDLFKNQEDVNTGVTPMITPSEGDMDRIRSTLRHFVRDWSADGEVERDQTYTPILHELAATFPTSDVDRGNVRVLVPGCGLGRLAFEIRQKGFCTQGNEVSLYMLLASDFMFNRTTAANQSRIYPYLHQTTNLQTRADSIREVRIPDVCPTVLDENPTGGMNHSTPLFTPLLTQGSPQATSAWWQATSWRCTQNRNNASGGRLW